MYFFLYLFLYIYFLYLFVCYNVVDFPHLAVRDQNTNMDALISNSRVLDSDNKMLLFSSQNPNHRSNHFVLKVMSPWALFPKIETLLRDG